MTPALRICLLAGCAGVALLHAPGGVALLAEGVVGPYGARTGQAARASAQVTQSTESLGALRDAGGLALPGEEPWRKGLPRGL